MKGFIVFNDSPLWLGNLAFSKRRSCVTNSFVIGGEGKGAGEALATNIKIKGGRGGGKVVQFPAVTVN